MLFSETSHLTELLLLMITVAASLLFFKNSALTPTLMVVNTLFNRYPALAQQQNKQGQEIAQKRRI
jgi:hypothetical protein